MRKNKDKPSLIRHEMNGDLTVIRESVVIVLDGIAGDINEEQRNFLNMAVKSADKLAKKINETYKCRGNANK